MTKAALGFMLTVLISQVSIAQIVQSFIGEAEKMPVESRQQWMDEYVGQHREWPAVSGIWVTYLYKGKAGSVMLAGDHNNWKPADDKLEMLAGTDYWYAVKAFDLTARLDYKFVIDGKEWIADPLNSMTCSGAYGTNSELRMPAWKPSGYSDFDSAAKHGQLISKSLVAADKGIQYTFSVYLPAGYEIGNRSYPLLVFHDGGDYLKYGHALNILDNMIHAGRIEPLIAVFVMPDARVDDYAGKSMKRYGNFISMELLPWLGQNYRIVSDAGGHCTIGVSNGGNISLWLAASHSAAFGKAGAQSSSVTGAVRDAFNSKTRQNVRLYLEMAYFDIPELVEDMEKLTEVLEGKSYDFKCIRHHDGHSWCNWSTHLPDMLIHFFPRGK